MNIVHCEVTEACAARPCTPDACGARPKIMAGSLIRIDILAGGRDEAWRADATEHEVEDVAALLGGLLERVRAGQTPFGENERRLTCERWRLGLWLTPV
jgi:hypothetical protein